MTGRENTFDKSNVALGYSYTHMTVPTLGNTSNNIRR